ncbi:Wall-associated receptor kinase 2 [Glycine soja]
MHTQLALVLALALLVVHVRAITTRDIALHGYMDTCRNVSIPYPFGIGTSKETGENCFLEENLNLTCPNNNLYSRFNLQVLDITLKGHFMDSCFMSPYFAITPSNGVANDPFLRTASNFTISSKENKFISFPDDVATNGDYSGIGCCEVDIPPNMKNISIEAYRFDLSSNYFQTCGHSFVPKRGSYNFDISHLEKPFNTIPMVVDWSVRDDLGCEAFRKGFRKSACMDNSYCHDIDISYGYQCRC